MSPPVHPSHAGLAAIFAAALLGSGPARAEPPAKPEPAVQTPRLRLDALASRFDQDRALKEAGIARTALERPVSDRGAAAVGFLCGLAPSDRASGGASALGTDHDGRFLGAQFRLGFR